MEVKEKKNFSSHPKSAFWSSKNSITPDKVSYCSDKKFWFDCDVCGHDFYKSISDVSCSGTWCYYCSKSRLCGSSDCKTCFNNSFASNPLSANWSDKNTTTPNFVTFNSTKSYLFNCFDCGHEITKVIGNIYYNKTWCNFCASKTLCDDLNCNFCFNCSFASIEKSKYWSPRNQIQPNKVFKNSNKKFWFNCPDCKHEFDMIISGITNNRWCGFCQNQKKCQDQNCEFCFNNSFASHEKSINWSDKNTVKIETVSIKSSKKIWLDCPKCNHSYKTNANAAYNCENGCPYCYNLIVCGVESCLICFDKSFASHPNSEFWSDINKDKPINVLKGSNVKRWFNCNKCPHIFEIMINGINSKNRWCSYCSNQKLCPKENNCQTCYNKTIATHEKSKYWDYSKNTLYPNEVFKSTNKKFWFICHECDHSFLKIISDVSNESWCPLCVHKTERIFYKKMLEFYPTLKYQVKLDGLNKSTYDYILEEYKIIVELDGNFHRMQVSNWDSPEIVKKRDVVKMKYANENGYSIIRILQVDVLFNKYNWLEEIKVNIDYLIEKKDVENIFMCKNNEYDYLIAEL
jgi:very-short-patch-repair endonuclease